MKLSEIIEEYRREHGLSQRQFAAQCGVSNGYIAMLEKEINPKTGNPIVPTIPNLNKIAKGLGISMNELFTRADDMPVSMLDEYSEVFSDETAALMEECGLDDNLDLALCGLINCLTPEEKIKLYEELEKKAVARKAKYIPVSEKDRTIIRYVHRADEETKDFLLHLLEKVVSKGLKKPPVDLASSDKKV